MTVWLAGAERDETRPQGAGPFAGPVRIGLFHKTQGDGIEGARSTLHAKGAEPHFLTEIRAAKGRRNIQMVWLDRAAKALRNQAGGVETNRLGVIQWEIVGFSEVEHEHDYDEADWLWFGSECVGPVCDLLRIRKAAVPFHDYPPEDGHRLGAEPWRMTFDEWRTFRGLCGHQHAPENAHGDPGNLSRPIYRNGTTSAIDLILEGAGATPEPEPPKGWLDMLSDAEQTELLAKTREIHRQVTVSADRNAKGGATLRWLSARLGRKV